MFRRNIASLFSSALLVALLPLAVVLAVSDVLSHWRLVNRRSRARMGSSSLVDPVGEFEFHRALIAYEDLIEECIGDSAA